MSDWKTTPIEELFSTEGNNVQVLSKFFKNVLIRWDKKFKKEWLDYQFGNNSSGQLEEERKEKISEIIVFVDNAQTIKIELPLEKVKNLMR